MELLDKALRIYRGFSNEPMMPDDQQDDLENNQETIFNDCDQNNLALSPVINDPLAMPNEDVIIDFATEGINQTTLSPERQNAPIRTQGDRNNIQRDINYKREIENIITNTLYGVLKWNAVSGFVFTLLIFTIKFHFSFMYILLTICLVDIYTLLNLLCNSPQFHAPETRRYIVDIIQTILSAAAKISLIVYDYIESFHLIYSFAPSLIFDMLYAVSLAIKSRKSPLRTFYIAQLLLKVTTTTLVASIILKVDHILPWSWEDILASFWVLFSVLVGITILAGLIFVLSFRKFFVQMRFHQLCGLAWLILVCGGALTFLGLLAHDLEKAFEHRSPHNNLAFIFIMTAGYNIGMVIYTTFYFKKIRTFFRRLAAIEVQEDSSAFKIQGEKQEDSPDQKVSIPFFLARSSGTFFRRATQDDINSTTKSKASKSKDTSPKSKGYTQNKHYRRGSLDGFAKMGSEKCLRSIPETEREQGRDGAPSSQRSSLWTKRRSPGFNRSIPSVQQIASFASIEGERNKFGATSSSRRNLCDGSDNEFVVTDAFCSPRGRQNQDIDSLQQQIQMEQIGLSLKEMKSRPVSNDFDQNPGNGEPPVSRRRGQSLHLLPGTQIPGLSEIAESPSFKENSRTEGETGASPTHEVSGVQQCLICFDKQPDAVFMECGHGGVCYGCSLEIWKTTNECYLCRKVITQVVQVDYKLKLGKNILQVVSVTQMVLNNRQSHPHF